MIGEFEFLWEDFKWLFELVGTEYITVLQCIILLCRALSCTEQGGYRSYIANRGDVCCVRQ